jgi:hypothetical protein
LKAARRIGLVRIDVPDLRLAHPLKQPKIRNNANPPISRPLRTTKAPATSAVNSVASDICGRVMFVPDEKMRHLVAVGRFTNNFGSSRPEVSAVT